MKRAFFGAFAVAVLALPVLAMAPESGLKVGEMVSAFHPTHIAGPDKGTDTCPPCKYGNRPAVQVWTNGDDAENVVALANNLNERVTKSAHEFRGFVINLTECDKCVDMTKTMAGQLKGDKVAMAYLPKDHEAIGLYKVNVSADVKNTVFVYKNRKVVAKFVNLKADKAGLASLNAAIAKIDN